MNKRNAANQRVNQMRAVMADEMDFDPEDRAAAQRSLMARRHATRAEVALELRMYEEAEREEQAAIDYMEGNR